MPIVLNGSGTITGISAGGLPDGIIQAADLASGVGGKILQVVQTVKTDTFSNQLAQGAYTTALLTQSITPSSASSKILVLCTLHLTTGSQTGASGAKIQRDGSDIGVADADGSRSRGIGAGGGGALSARVTYNMQMTFLDTPNSTSALSYTVHAKHGYAGNQYIYINRELTDNDSSRTNRSTSSLTLMEVAA